MEERAFWLFFLFWDTGHGLIEKFRLPPKQTYSVGPDKSINKPKGKRHMPKMFVAVTIACSLFAGAHLAAQTGAPTAPNPPELAMGTTEGEPQMGQPYTTEKVGSWERRCMRTNQDQAQDPCQLYQLLEDDLGNAVSEITLFKLDTGGQAVAGATIIVPLETLLTEQLKLRVDEGPARIYPFSFCTSVGCIARIGLTNDDIDSLKRGSAARLSLVPVAAPDQLVILKVPLDGFSVSYSKISPLED